MKKKLLKLIRLFVACTINHNDEYYQNGLKSLGVDYTQLTHTEISAYKAMCRIIEADMLIDVALNGKKSSIEDIDIRIFDVKKPNKTQNEKV